MAAGLAAACALMVFLLHLGVVEGTPIVIGVPALYLAWLVVPPRAKKSARGRRMREWDPVDLGVHRVVGGGPMPPYIRRRHDDLLAAVLDPAVRATRLVVLRGGSSTGKSRAAYEAVTSRLAGWRLDYPQDPGALTARLKDAIPARTVLWLGDLHHYADADGGPAALSGLADLLDGQDQIVITTIWTEDWHKYTDAAQTARRPADPAGVARRLLERLPALTDADSASIDPARGGVIDVPPAFNSEDLDVVANTGDSVLAEAAAAAVAAGQGGQVTQYLAGVPALLRRYAGPGGDPYGQAVITAAMDAARLGHASLLPAALLHEAAVEYLTNEQRTKPITTWAQTAMDWAADKLDGAVRALQPVAPVNGTGVHGYRIADYLDQHGRRTRCEQPGPLSLWDALAAHTSSPTDLLKLSQAAENRGLYRQAATLFTKGTALGSVYAAAALIRLLHDTCPEDARNASHWALAHISPEDPIGVAGLLDELRDVGAGDAARALADQAAAHASLNEPSRVAWLLNDLREAGADDAARVLADRAAAHASLDDPESVASLLKEFREAGADDAARALADQAAAHASLDDRRRVAMLLRELREAGAHDAARDLSERAAAQANLSDSAGIDPPYEELPAHMTEDKALPERAARASLDDPAGVARLLRELREAGAHDAARDLSERAAAQAALDDPGGVARLLRELRYMGADGTDLAVDSFYDPFGVGVLRWELQQEADELDPSVPSFYDPLGVGPSLKELRQAGADGTIQTLLGRGPAAQAALDDPGGVARLLEEFRLAGADTPTRTLLARDPAAQASLDDPSSVAALLRELRAAGADDTARSLAGRVATHTSLEYPRGVARLLTQMQAAGAEDATRVLARRAANFGWFQLALGFLPDEAARYRFGRQPDETPAQPWRWQQPGGAPSKGHKRKAENSCLSFGEAAPG